MVNAIYGNMTPFSRHFHDVLDVTSCLLNYSIKYSSVCVTLTDKMAARLAISQFAVIKKMADVDFTTMLCEPELVMISDRTVLFAYINLGINNIYLTNFMVLMLCLFGDLFKISKCFLLAKDYGKIDKPPSFLLSSIENRKASMDCLEGQSKVAENFKS